MKKTIIAAIVMASLVVTAEEAATTAPAAPATTETAAPAATTETAPEAKKAVKKAKKKKAAAKPNAQVAPVAPATAVAQAAPIVTNDMAPVAAAAGTSTAAAPEAQAPKKKWGLGASVYSTADSQSVKDVQTLTSISASYQVTDSLKVRAKQTFETLTAGTMSKENREIIEENNFRPTYADFSVSSSLPGILGSNKLPVSLNYKLISGDAIYSTTGGYASAHGFVEGNLSIPYTLSPKWELSIDTQIRHVIRKTGPNTHRFLAIPTASYALTDKISLFQTAGMIWSTDRNERIRKTAERLYLATGASFAPMKGLSIDVDVYQDKAVSLASNSPYDVTPFSLYKANQSDRGADATFDAVGYEATLSYSY